MAAENGALPGGKVGGVGDVIRDLPAALAAEGWRSTVLTPAYGKFHIDSGAAPAGSLHVLFRGAEHEVELFELETAPGVTTLLFHHGLLAPGGPGKVYHDDGADRPFATDASTFAFFCAAAAVWVASQKQPPNVVHLHDWHAAWYLVMRDFTPLGEKLHGIRTVFTIHNLAYQGQRPFEGDESSLVAWFPGMLYDPAVLADPNSGDSVNPMAYAIRVSDVVNTVSPTYAQEICQPSDPSAGFYGGEGLESDLAAAGSRLRGILNGCDYSRPTARRLGWQRLIEQTRDTVEGWLAKSPDSTVHKVALRNLAGLPKRRPSTVFTSIGRVVDQKMRLFFQPLADGRSSLDHILDRIGKRGVLFLLGSGDSGYEQSLERLAEQHSNLIFLNGYAEELGNSLYLAGDFFLMPSSFEPCGISQMLAMRAGQPCIVHGVGGLRDTVDDSVTGLVFDGSDGPLQQAGNFVASVGRAVDMLDEHPDGYRIMQDHAKAQRFDWASSAKAYIETMYEYDIQGH
ncbi:MAG: glycogen/starch synthase [Pseudomonadota bacterium]